MVRIHTYQLVYLFEFRLSTVTVRHNVYEVSDTVFQDMGSVSDVLLVCKSRFRRVNTTELTGSVTAMFAAGIVAIQSRSTHGFEFLSSRVSLPPNVSTDVPKRGRKGGVRERSRRTKCRTPLPW